METKPRIVSNELSVYRILNSRKVLQIEEAVHLARLEKGYEGGLLFDERLGKIKNDWLVLNDLQLVSNNNDFQIDSLLIAEKPALLFEIKNYEGDYYIEGDNWYYSNGTEIQNPMSQLERSEFLLRRLLRDLGYKIPLETYIIFINPDFHLYNAPRNLPIIYPTQLNRFFDNLRNMSSAIIERHQTLAHKLISLHKKNFPLKKIPKYSYEELRKGVTCASCYSFNIESKKSVLVCKNCGCMDKFEEAVLRSLDEYSLLFPERKITTNDIYEWCKGIVSKKSIQRILLKNFNLKGSSKAAYYVRKK